MPMLCCYAKRRRASPAAKSPEQRHQRDIFGMRLAKLDEFESLTPLMVMTGGSDERSSSRRHRITPITSRSPPPPRCLTNGKTMIVPLNSGKGCRPFTPLLATPESKGTSCETDVTTKSYNTIVEDNENIPSSSNLDKADADFISIDRTTVSYLEPRQQRLQQCECGIPKLEKAPTFELPTPSYAPPPLPVFLVRSPRFNLRKELATVISKTNSSLEINNDARAKKSPSNHSVNSLGSPQDSSFSTGSPLDTSASISDSFCVTGEGEMNSDVKGRVYSLETGQQRIDTEIYGFSPESDYSISEPDSQQKYILHRIEEESEQNCDIDTAGMVTSQTLDSIKSIFSHANRVDSQCNIIIPHTIIPQ
uniref:Uncharacterized protein n=1 Tax=Elaeophora elaphi TaxID=1147741 RepID=A0A0R3RGB9_9BILA